MTRQTDADRRTYLKGIGVAATLVGGMSVATGAVGGEASSSSALDHREGRGDDSADSDEIPPAHPFVGDLDGETLSGDMEFDVENRYDGDPDEDNGRDWVVHYTTDGEETQDYPAALINLRKRLERGVTLGDLDELTFDFFVGPDHDQYIPGQVYLVIQDPEQRDDDKAWGLYKNVRKGGSREEWRTLDVIEEMSADGTDAPWRALEIDIDPDGFRANFDTFADAVLERAIDTRDEEGDTFDDVFDRLGDDATLLAIGLGSGSSHAARRRDIYFDDYHLEVDEDGNDGDDGGDGEHTFELPAALQMDTDIDRDGQIIAELTFPEQPEWVDLDDLDEDTVRLYSFSQIMPPQGESVEPSRVEVHDHRIEARFSPGRVRRLVGGGQRRLTVAGEFDYEHVVWFFGHDQVTVPGN